LSPDNTTQTLDYQKINNSSFIIPNYDMMISCQFDFLPSLFLFVMIWDKKVDIRHLIDPFFVFIRFLYPCFMNSNIFLDKMNQKVILKVVNIREGVFWIAEGNL
jgi:hypothetical protein